MSVHLIKLAVGAESISSLVAWQHAQLHYMARQNVTPELVHVTRNTPKRGAELLDGGSLYWIIKGWVCARQRIVELRAMDCDGAPHCGIVLAPELVRVHPRKHKPFQGWRYLDANAAPADLSAAALDASDDSLTQDLAALGLL